MVGGASVRPENGTAHDNVKIMDALQDEIAFAVAAGVSHRAISATLQQQYHNQRGFSRRSVRRFCRREGIHYRTSLPDPGLDRVIQFTVIEVGHSYGRRTMTGLLRSQGIVVGENRVARSMQRVAPAAQIGRRQRARRHLNPPPYTARFFGDKVHFDHNEKLAMYGVTHVLAIDEFCRKIVGMITIPVKNPISIYGALMRPMLLQFGLWQQVRVDHGTEFTLILAAQQHLARHRQWQDRQATLQTTSQNHRVERMWPEINQRMNYPVKRVLVRMEGNDDLDMTNATTKFCVSWLTIQVIESAVRNFIAAWNSHRIPGSGGSIRLATRAPQTTALPPSLVPTVSEMVALYCQGGRRLTPEHTFGSDPIAAHSELQHLRSVTFFIITLTLKLYYQVHFIVMELFLGMHCCTSYP